MTKMSRLVYSTNPQANQKCVKCGELQSECVCVKEMPLSKAKFVALIRIEKQGRGGKTVTSIDRLPKVEVFLKELTTFLKKKCGSGGTFRTDGIEGVIEIQGDKRALVRVLLAERGISFKG